MSSIKNNSESARFIASYEISIAATLEIWRLALEKPENLSCGLGPRCLSYGLAVKGALTARLCNLHTLSTFPLDRSAYNAVSKLEPPQAPVWCDSGSNSAISDSLI